MMTIQEFCEQYNKTEATVSAKIHRNKDILNEHILKTPYTKTIMLDEYAIEFLLTDQRTANAVDNSITFASNKTDKPVKDDTQIYRSWSAEKSAKVMTMCLKEARSHKNALKYVPDGFKTYDLCKCAVKFNGMALEFVPQMYITDELCRIAVSNCYTALAFVPSKYMTEEMIINAFDNFSVDETGNCEYLDYKRKLLGYVPEKMRSEELCLKAITAQASNVKYIPRECFTDAIIKQALTTNIGIKYIPTKFFYVEKIISLALRSSEGRKRIPIEYWTKLKIIETIKNFGFDGIPREMFDYNFYVMLINEHYIRPEQILNYRYYSDGLSEDEINSIQKISFERKEQDDKYYDLIQQDPYNIKSFPIEDEEYNLYASIAVSSCGKVLKYIPLDKRTFGLCEKAVINDVSALLYVPNVFKEKIIELLSQRDDLLKYIFEDDFLGEIFIK